MSGSCPDPAAASTLEPADSQSAADALEAWLRDRPGQKALLTNLDQFYKLKPAAGRTVKHKGIRPFAASYGQRFRVSGNGHAMTISATSCPRAEERRYDTDGVLYTKAEFVGEYGGTREWEQAKREAVGEPPAPRPPASASAPSGTARKPSPRTMTLEDTDGPETTLAAQIREDEGSDDVDLNLAASPDSDDDEIPGIDLDQALAKFFSPQLPIAARDATLRTTLYGGDGAFQEALGAELGLLGHLQSAGNGKQRAQQNQLYINVTDPFCLITVGVQGAGKSHTTACILESCLLPFPPVVNVRQPMAVLVCHYDQSDVNCCEATGLSSASAKIAALLNKHGEHTPPPSLGADHILVLCSPSFYHQRKKYYEGVCEVKPLLFRWNGLKAQQQVKNGAHPP